MISVNDYAKVYVVTVEGEVERQEHCTEQLSKHNIDFEFSITRKPKRPLRGLSLGATGCHNGHKQAIMKGSLSRAENVLILEDDVVLCEDFNERFDSFINEVGDRKFNVLSLGYDIQNSKTEHKVLSDTLLKLNHCWAGQSYIIPKYRIQYLISLYNKRQLIPDWYLSKYLISGYGIYAPYPAMTKQALFDSLLLGVSPLTGYNRDGASTWLNILTPYSDLL